MLKGVALKEHEVIVGRLMYHVLPYVCALSSTISNKVSDMAYGKNKKAMLKAE